MRRTVFFISDGTGITAQTLGHSLLTQFENILFEKKTIPYVNSSTRAQEVVDKIDEAYSRDRVAPLVFATLIDPDIHEIIKKSKGVLLDFFNTFIGPLEKTLKMRSSHTIGRTHGVYDYKNYMTRIEAVNYALTTDDGVNTKHYEAADLILIGVSRSGKTPTCLYLALQFGVSAANYPLTEEDLQPARRYLPKILAPYRHKLFGLTIDPHRLVQIRQERRPQSDYASLNQCETEVKQAEKLYSREGIAYLDTTTHSIEEIATGILERMGIERRL